MKALCNHFEGNAKLDIWVMKAQPTLDTLVYMSEHVMLFEWMITKSQEFTEKSKVEQIAKRFKNPT